MRKAFPLRVDAALLDALRAWAADDLRSVNAQIEFLLARALRDAGRERRRRAAGPGPPGEDGPSGEPGE